jgi:hypothetical protein
MDGKNKTLYFLNNPNNLTSRISFAGLLPIIFFITEINIYKTDLTTKEYQNACNVKTFFSQLKILISLFLGIGQHEY